MEQTGKVIGKRDVEAFRNWLIAEERSENTVEKYVRDVRALEEWLEGRALCQESAAAWKRFLAEGSLRPATVNSMLAAVNAFCRFAGIDCRVKFLRVQKSLFRDEAREMTKEDYEKLVAAARTSGRERLALLMTTIGSVGIRVSEVRYVTVEALRARRAQIALKGKIRTILFPKKLCRLLLDYAKKKKITSGEIFVTGSGKTLSRKQIWAEMKSLCARAHVAKEKVFPHNLRHLFACAYYRHTHDVAKLADLLGHSSIETTRIYLASTGREQARELDELKLIILT